MTATVHDLDARRPGYRLSVEFDCTDAEAPAFVRGWECGQLYARLEASPPTRSDAGPEWSGTYHVSNVVMLRRIAAALGYGLTLQDSGDPGWVFAEFRRMG